MGILLLPIFDCFQSTDVIVINSISEEWSYLNNSLKSFVKSYEQRQTPISGMDYGVFILRARQHKIE